MIAAHTRMLSPSASNRRQLNRIPVPAWAALPPAARWDQTAMLAICAFLPVYGRLLQTLCGYEMANQRRRQLLNVCRPLKFPYRRYPGAL